jgi:all-trans-retinol 13,14-reductase
MKVAVVGAGASGVYSALILARYGHKVTLLEAGRQLAPLLRGFSRQGLQFDTGFHHSGSLELGGVLRRYFNFVGLERFLTLTPYRTDCCELFRFTSNAAEDLPLPQGRALVGALAARWSEHSKFIESFFANIEQAYTHSPFIDPRRLSVSQLTLPAGTKLSDQLDSATLPARLRSLLTARSIYYGTPPHRALFEEFALVARSMQTGVYSIAGGGAAIAAAFEQALRLAGVEVKTGRIVKSIEVAPVEAQEVGSVAKLGVTGVTTNSDRLSCDFCVYTGHPAHLPELLPPGSLRKSMSQHLRSLEETSPFFMFFGSTRSSFLNGCSMVLCTVDDIEEAYASSNLQYSWLHISAGSVAENGRYPIFAVTRFTPPPPEQEKLVAGAVTDRSRPNWYKQWKERFTIAVKKHIITHVPELNDLEAVESCTSYSLRDWVYGSSGSIYGAMHHSGGMPVLPFTRIEGVFLAGQSVLLPGLLGAFISAAVACGSIVGYEQLFRDLSCTSAEL